MLNRRVFLTGLGGAARLAAAPARPNLLFMVADEWRGQALPSAGDPDLKAPNLARLAAEGVDFRRAYTSYPVCCPSRAAMLTGKLPHAAGVPRNHMRLPADEWTLSEELKRAGYRTGYIGKWHLDGREGSGYVPPARRRGFDYWAAHNLNHRHYGSVYFKDSPEPVPVDGFEPDHQTGLALDFLRGAGSPFFLYLSWVAPHPPLTPPPRHAVYDPGRIRLRHNVPESGRREAAKKIAAYYGLCSAVDENVGRLLAELDRLRIAENTIVVFTSDHGTTLGSHGIDEIDQPYEEAARIPFIIRYPARLRRRTVRDALISNVDYAPTLLALCGAEAPSGIHGVDYSKWLTRGGQLPRNSVYSQGQLGTPGEWRMVVRDQGKLAAGPGLHPKSLYSLDSDPYERRNLAAEPRSRRKRDEMLGLLREWMARTSDRFLHAPAG